MRIVIDARKVRDFGIGSYIQGVGGECARLAPEHSFVFLGSDAALATPPLNGPNVRWAMNRSKNYGLAELLSVSWQTRQLDADLFHAPHYVYPVMLPCPGVVTVHDCIHLRFPKQLPNRAARLYAKLMIWRAVREATRVITGSHATRSDLVELVGADPAKIEIIRYGCDPYYFEDPAEEELDAARQRHGLDRPFLLYVGNIKPHKNLRRLIQAFAELADDYADYELVLVGDELKRHPALEKELRGLGLENRVRFLGYLPKEQLRALYRLSTVFVFPSLYEGFGLPPLEAMAGGTPVVAARSSALPEVIGDAGLLVNPYKVDALAEAIRRLLESENMRSALGALGRERARKFSWTSSAQRLLGIYAEVSEG